jgi:hypothetical protein
MEINRKFLIAQVTNSSEDLKTNILEFLHEKLTLLLHFISTTFTSLSQYFDQIFPPETRQETIHHWIHIAVSVVLPVALAAFLVFYCCRCCCRSSGRSRGYGRMMTAPGRGGAHMPRVSFEASPRDYFINLRAKKPLVY